MVDEIIATIQKSQRSIRLIKVRYKLKKKQ